MINLDNEIDAIKNRIKNKRISNIENKNDIPKKMQYFKGLLSRTLITVILVLISVIYTNSSDKNLLAYKEQILTKSFSFAPFKNWYQKHFGEILPIDIETEPAQTVFSDELVYTNIEEYQNGYKLTVQTNSIINNITSGIVVYIGEKEGYGNVLIVQGIDGVDIWYCNITNTNLTLYDYVEENTILGEAKGDYVYFVLSKDGEYLNYEEYINEFKDQ